MRIIYILLFLSLLGCGCDVLDGLHAYKNTEPLIGYKDFIKEIKFAEYVSKDYSDIERIERGFVLKESDNFYWVIVLNDYQLKDGYNPLRYKSYRDKNEHWAFKLNKNPTIRKEGKNGFGKVIEILGLWEDGDRVKEGKLCEE